jgi:hypothetical protein
MCTYDFLESVCPEIQQELCENFDAFFLARAT